MVPVALVAGALYYAIVFAAGFVLGTLRTLVLEPALGRAAATVLEAPLILAASFLAARALIGRFSLPPAILPRFAMGATALTLLLVSEALLARPLRGWSFAEWISRFATIEGLMALARYVVFAGIPIVALRRLP